MSTRKRATEESTSSVARDIANATYQDVIGARHRPATHRKEHTP